MPRPRGTPHRGPTPRRTRPTPRPHAVISTRVRTLAGASTPEVCGAFSSQIQAYSIVVYTTRTGIGFTGTATSCGTRKVSFEVVVQDLDPDPACTVEFPHFIAERNTDPGMTVTWQANSTLVPCRGKAHVVVLTLWDTRTNTRLAERTASAFL